MREPMPMIERGCAFFFMKLFLATPAQPITPWQQKNWLNDHLRHPLMMMTLSEFDHLDVLHARPSAEKYVWTRELGDREKERSPRLSTYCIASWHGIHGHCRLCTVRISLLAIISRLSGPQAFTLTYHVQYKSLSTLSEKARNRLKGGF